MAKKEKVFKIVGITLMFVLIFCTSTLATSFAGSEKEFTFDEAKAYLLTYNDTSLNDSGKEVRTKYEFSSSEKLDSAARYISENGLSAFNEKVEKGIENYLQSEEKPIARPRETSPMSIQKVIKGNGTHSISGTTHGLAKFKTLGTGEYTAKLSYSVVVSKGKITRLSSDPTLTITLLSGGLSKGDVTIRQVIDPYTASITAKFEIVKSVNLGWIQVKSETDVDVFGVAALLS